MLALTMNFVYNNISKIINDANKTIHQPFYVVNIYCTKLSLHGMIIKSF